MSFSCPFFIAKDDDDTFFFFKPPVKNCGLCKRWNCSSCSIEQKLLMLGGTTIVEIQNIGTDNTLISTV